MQARDLILIPLVFVGTAVMGCKDPLSSSSSEFGAASTQIQGNILPLVSISRPFDGATFTTGDTIRIDAKASDSDGTIRVVRFYADTLLLGADTTAPYSIVWRNLRVGVYNLRATAIDNSGATQTSRPVTVTITSSSPNMPPVVWLTTVLKTETYKQGDTVPLIATARDTDGVITAVRFYKDTLLSDGSRAFILDHVDTIAPYTYTFRDSKAGIYTFRARATDNRGASTFSPDLRITVSPNMPPVVWLTTVLKRETYKQGDTVPLIATARDTDGVITAVRFYKDTLLSDGSRPFILDHVDTIAPYTYTFRDRRAGIYTLRARATDNQGASTFSPDLRIAVLAKLSGTAFGTSPAWSTGSEFDKAFDGRTSTYFDFSARSGGYTGIDVATRRTVRRIRFFPRNGYSNRMIGGKFQGSNTSNSSGYSDLFTITTQPQEAAWTEVGVSDTTRFRYLRYLGGSSGNCNVAEIEFWGY